MSAKIRALSGAFAVGALLALAAVPTAEAASEDYRFEPVQRQVRSGDDSQVAVRLVHVPTGKPVENAVIFQTRLDMSPMGMAAMTAKATPVKAQEPGVYEFRAPLGMDGDWALHLSAKVQGETGTVRGTVQFKAVQ